MSKPELIRLPDGDALRQRLADDIAARLEAGVAARGTASLVVPGGSTPGPVFDELSGRDLPWDRITLTLNDERWVDDPDPGSNARLLRERLRVGRAAAVRFVGLKTPAPTPEAGVAEVERRLAEIPRPFDVMLLGMGGDGHTASLFPGSPALQASLNGDAALVQAVEEKGARGAAARISLSLPALLDSRFIAVLITGEDKLETLERAEGGSDPMQMPIRAVFAGAASPVQVYWAP